MVYGFINHNESNENKFHSSVLVDLQQYPFQHGQPAVIQSLSGTQSNRAASVNICWDTNQNLLNSEKEFFFNHHW